MSCKWNHIFAGFNTEDETINFGTRAVIESDGSIFESTTLASIQAEGEVLQNPFVRACTHPKAGVVIAIDNSLSVFSDESCSQVCTNVQLDSTINCFAVSDDGIFLFVAVSSGDVHCLHLPSHGKRVFTRSISEENNLINIIFHPKDKYVYDILLFGCFGNSFRIPNINLKSLSDAVNEDSDLLQGLVNIICIENLNLDLGENCKVASVTTLNNSGSFVFGGNEIHLWSQEFKKEDGFILEDPQSKIKKLCSLHTANFVMCLTEDGQLWILCMHTLSWMPWGEFSVQDYILLDSLSENDGASIVLLTNADERNKSFIHLVTFPGLEIKYSLNVLSPTYLVPGPPSVQEVLFLEGVHDCESSEFINTLNIKAIVESLPQYSFERILRRKKFAEAESFARRFGLDVQEVYKSEAKHYLYDLHPLFKSQVPPQNYDISLAINVLNNIQDVEFICEACVNAITINISQTRKLLCYARERLSCSRIKNVKHEEISSKICTTLIRLETFEMIHGAEPEAGKLWLSFCAVDLLKECKRHILQGELRQASSIWSRHLSSFKHCLSDEILLLLECIPGQIQEPELFLWLKTFIPTVLTLRPQSFQHLITWTINRIRAAELERNSWPEAGLEFAEKMFSLINGHSGVKQGSMSRVQFKFYRQCSTLTSLQQLVCVIKSLKEIKQLKDIFCINLLMDDFMQNDKSKVVTILLDKIVPDEITPLMNGFLQKFMLENYLQPDVVISQYIEDTVSFMGHCYEEAPWETTVSALVQCIHNPQILMESILIVLKMAVVPWSTTITLIAELGLQVDHPLAAEIKQQQELINVKLIWKKYSFKYTCVHKPINIDLIQYVIKQGREEMYEDVLQLAASNELLLQETKCLCVEHYIKVKQYKRAVEILDTLEPEMILKCCKVIIFTAQCYMQNKFCDIWCIDYCQLLSTIFSKYLKTLEKFGNHHCVILPVEEIQNIYFLYQEFGRKVTMDDYVHSDNRCSVLKECVQELVANKQELQKCDSTLHCIYNKVERITSLLKFTPEKGIIRLAEQLLRDGCYANAMRVIRGLLGDINQEYPDIYAFLKLFIQTDIQCSGEECMKTSLSSIQELCNEASTHCSSDWLLSWVHLLQWTSVSQQGNDMLLRDNLVSEKSGYYIKQDYLAQWRITPLFQEPSGHTTTIFSFVRNMFLLYVSKTPQITPEDDPSHSNEGHAFLPETLPLLIEVLKNEHCLLAAFRVICTFSWAAAYNSIVLNDVVSIRSNCAMIFLRKCLLLRQVDVTFGLSILCMLSLKDALQELDKYVKYFKQDCHRLGSVAELGMSFCAIFKLEDQRREFARIRKQCLWGKKFEELNISYELAFENRQNIENVVLKNLLSKKQVSISLVEEFSLDFEIDMQECFLTYIQTIILNWEPDITRGRNEKLIIKNCEKEIVVKCKALINKISNKKIVGKLLISLWEVVNYYYYEIYMAIEELLRYIKLNNFKKEYQLLLFLKSYNRVKLPELKEKEKWLQAFPDTSCLPAIAKWRLPFFSFMKGEAWKVVESELNLNTYKKWLEASPLLDLQKNLICSAAIKEAVNSKFRGNSNGFSAEIWCIAICENVFLSQVKECISHCSDLEMASATLYYVVNHTPSGADQVAAAELCVQHTKKWADSSTDMRHSETLKKVIKKYLLIKTKHILYCYGLGQPQYLQCVQYPQELLSLLYTDARIVTRGRGAPLHCPDINSAVVELAKLHTINLIAFQVEKLERWLQHEQTFLSDYMDETCHTIVGIQQCTEDRTDEDNLLRACYMLEGCDTATCGKHLTNLAFCDSINRNSLSYRLRALECLVSAFSKETLEHLTSRDILSIQCYMKNLRYTSQLEMLGYTHVSSVSEFELKNKTQLVEDVVKVLYHKPKAIILMAHLCLDFNIYQYELWESLLSLMSKFAMINDLKEILPQLIEHGHIMCSSEYTHAWHVVLLTPFEKGGVTLSSDGEKECLDSLDILQSCPILSKIDIISICKNCFRLNKPHLAAVLLPFLHEDQQEWLIKKLISQYETASMLNDLRQLSALGIMSTAQATSILESSIQEFHNK